ncbi:MAG: AAA family ATPase [Candidatus Gastranaerophilales bacterium]|nr:AAA family ATPase [Candidatus Gastranaerophilales bacterium]
MQTSGEVSEILGAAFALAKSARYEYVTPELALYVICQNKVFARAFENCGGNVRELDYHLRTYLDEYMEALSADAKAAPEISQSMGIVLAYAWESAQNSGKDEVELTHIIHAMYGLEESYAVYFMRVQGVERAELLEEMALAYEEEEREDSWGELAQDEKRLEAGQEAKGQEAVWKEYALCLNDSLEQTNPLIGREKELERTMQILCRKDKNNPLHIGEPGVGKTAVTYGLARLLNEGRVPKPLLGAKIFALDLGSLLAGTQYRGEFEKRFKRVMDSICKEEKPIIYIDDIHNIVGAGAVNGGSFDISNMIKPYLAAGHVRFIGATTYEEYKKHFEKNRGLVRRFQNIDIEEPSVEDTVRILEGLREGYERFHGVCYEPEVLVYAAQMSAKFMKERYLPDKAIDLIDEAGAYRRMHPLDRGAQSVDKELIDEILSGTCHIPRQTVESNETEALATLEERLKKRVYGQDEAVAQVVNAVKFSRAGLLEEGKPLASLLFVGPTGVGKTEIAKSLAEELGIKLIRFDMSEYEEKHAVAKLIGAPAGYVGYEEGGLLTEEIRKNPHAVLLLDEVEKAHPDIYNILLQVMDYATLTDNQGRKADFRNVVIIMTSNAGASRIGKQGIGFGGGGQEQKTGVILEEVKQIFQPEFRNRLNRIVVFRAMDDKMAEQIVAKKLGELGKLLSQKKVIFSADEAARRLVKEKGVSIEFGAREIDRVIQSEIKPLLVDQILFGELKEGGACELYVDEVGFALRLMSSP